MPKKDEEAERLIEEQLSGEEFFWKKVEENGTPLIIPQQNGKCDVIFLYRSSEPSLDLSVESEDLYNHLLEPETGAPKKFYKKDNTDIYYLRVQDVPEDTCVKYAFKIGEVDQIDQYNKARNENGSYLQMPKSAPPKEIVRNNSKVDNFVSPDPNAIAQPNISELELNHGLLTKDLKNEREIFIYKPKEYDQLNTNERKVVFVFDGKEFAKSMIPSLDESSHHKDTAFVFVEPKTYNHPDIPDRVYEYYFEADAFSAVMSSEIIPGCCKELKVEKNNNVMLAAHSLAGYPALNIANCSEKIGGVILASPAFNKNKEPLLPPENLPIYMSVGQLEDVKPTKLQRENEDTKDISLLEACQNFHTQLKGNGNTASEELNIHPYGHSSEHVLETIFRGMECIDHQKAHANTEGLTPLSDTSEFKSRYQKICGGHHANTETPEHTQSVNSEEGHKSTSPLNTTFKPY